MLKRFRSVTSALVAVAAIATLTLLQASPAAAATAKKPAKPKPVAVAAPKPANPAKPAKVRAPEKSLEQQRAEDGLWAKRTNWMSVRAGYAKSTSKGAGDGLAGYGVAYQRMLNNQWSLGGSVHHELLGHFNHSSEVAVPFTLEMSRHFKWKTAIRPYVGMGGGYYFHKYYRTGNNYTGAPGSGYFFNLGANLPLDDRHLIGLDTRLSMVEGRPGVTNPVFGREQASEKMWSVKLNWALAY